MNYNKISVITVLLVLLACLNALATENSVPESKSGIAKSSANASNGAITFDEEFDHPCERYTLETIELRKMMKEIEKIYADDPTTLQRIIKAQAAWDTYVKWHVEALYGGPESYGSAADTCNCINMLPVIELRLQQLRYWRDGTVEGDVCAGHVKWLKKE